MSSIIRLASALTVNTLIFWIFSEMLATKCVLSVFDYSTVFAISVTWARIRPNEAVEVRLSMPRVPVKLFTTRAAATISSVITVTARVVKSDCFWTEMTKLS